MDYPVVPDSTIGLVLAGAMSMYTGQKVSFVDGFTKNELLQRADAIEDLSLRSEFRRIIGEIPVGTSGLVPDSPAIKELVVTYKPTNAASVKPATQKQGAVAVTGTRNHWANRIAAESFGVGIDPDFAILVAKKESNLNPSARSPTGAGGLFQLTTIAIQDVAARYPISGDKRMDPEWNIFVGLRFLSICAGYAGIPSGARNKMDEEARIATYACFNVGVGVYRKLLKGVIDPVVIASVSQQAPALKRGGPGEYLSNVQEWLSA